MSLSVDQIRNLLDLRFLHERGVQEIRHNAPGRRAVGVILLDAANERAVFEVATSLGLPEKRELDAQVSAVANRLGDKWATSSWTTVLRLHKARNGVQHQGLGIDPTNIGQWIAASRSFVHDVVRSMYDISIWTLTAADAISNPEWAGLLRSGEDHAAEKRFPDAIMSYSQLFVQLDRRLESLRSRSTSIMPPFPHDIGDQKTYDFLNRRIEESARLSWFSTIAVDSFELQWFENLMQETRWATAEDADRAHALLFWAVAAFESVDPTGRPDRRQQWEVGQRKTRPAGSNISARPVSQHVGQQEDRNLRVAIRFADVPNGESDYRRWSSGVQQAIQRGEGTSFVWMDGAGALSFSLEYVDSYQYVAALIKDAIAAGEDAVREARAAIAEGDARRREIVERLSPTICSDVVPAWVLDRVIGFSDRASDGPEFPVVLLSIAAETNGNPYDRSLHGFVHEQLPGVQFWGMADDRWVFSPVDRWDELLAVLLKYDIVQRERREEQANAAAERERAVEQLSDVLRSLNIPAVEV